MKLMPFFRLALLLCLPCLSLAEPASDPEIDLIRQAMPGAVPAPQQPHKVLVYSKPWGFPHASIKIGKKMMQVMADESGLFEVTISDDLAHFAPERLAEYDAVCLNNTTHLQKGFVKPAIRQSLLDFVKNGGGLVAIHSATDGGWPEYTDMIGGNFDGHPWGAGGTWSIANEDPDHPIVRDVYGGKPFLLKDELYQYKAFDRSKVRVLLSVDMTAFQNLGRGEKRADGDYALAWVRDYGQGRVFVSSLGHNKEIFYHPEILKMWVEGFRFVLGETDVDTTPLAKPELSQTDSSSQRHEARVRTPEESLAEFEIQDDGYYIEVVAAEPLVDQPVLCTWDGDGNLYVAEMATYMNDIAGSDTLTQRSQVVRLEDTDGDCRMDKRIIFAKDLKLPRVILPLDDRILIGETDTNDLYAYRDTDGDGVADERELWWQGGNRGGNLEHQHSGLIWAMDNWIYSTKSNYRLRYQNGKVIKQTINNDQGQWGLTQDNVGKVVYVDAGSGRGPVHHLFPSIYTTWEPEWAEEESFRQTYAIDNIFDSHSGFSAMTDTGGNKGFTSACGQSVFRGDRLPADMQGDLFFGEPVGRLLRRSRWVKDDMGRRVLKNIYPGKEFIRSTDANFRPVNSATGPDGTLYMVDMQQGIIQESAWVPEGSFIHRAIKWYGLDQNIHNGRIYRIRHKDYELGERPQLLSKTPAQLIEYLSHPNGWWRDEAQKLIVLKGDTSIVPQLQQIVASDSSDYGRLHALWTLEGLDAINMNYLQTAFDNTDANVRAAAVRMSERYFHKDISLLSKLEPLADDPHHDVVIQLLLSMSTLVTPETRALAEKVLTAHPTNTYLTEIDQELNKTWFAEQAEKAAMAAMAAEERELMTAGKAHYAALCLSCHGPDGQGSPNPALKDGTMAPSFVGSPRVLGAKSTLARIALDGLSGPIDGKTYPGGIMVPLKANDDHYIASVLTYIRNSFGNEAEMITEAEVAAVRNDTKDRNAPYTQEELERIMLNAECPPSLWTITTTHRQEDAHYLADGDDETHWWSKHEQNKDMAIEVEFPHPRNLDHILVEARHGTDFPTKMAIEFSTDGQTWDHKIVADGANEFSLDFDQLVARKVKLSITEPKPKWWQIANLEITGPTESDIEKYPEEKRVYLTIEDATSLKQGWSAPKQNKSVLGQTLNVAGLEYQHGIGTHSVGEIIYDVANKGYQRFFTKCGPQGNRGKEVMTFEVYLDDRQVLDTGDMQAGDPAEYIDVNLDGVKQLKLIVTAGSDNETAHDHANWVDACFITE